MWLLLFLLPSPAPSQPPLAVEGSPCSKHRTLAGGHLSGAARAESPGWASQSWFLGGACGDRQLVGRKGAPGWKERSPVVQMPPKTSRLSGGEELIPAVEPGLSPPRGYNPNPRPSCDSTGVVGSGVGCCAVCQRGAAVGWGGSSQHPFVGLLAVSALCLCLPSWSSVAPVAGGICPAWHQGSQCSPPSSPPALLTIVQV